MIPSGRVAPRASRDGRSIIVPRVPTFGATISRAHPVDARPPAPRVRSPGRIPERAADSRSDVPRRAFVARSRSRSAAPPIALAPRLSRSSLGARRDALGLAARLPRRDHVVVRGGLRRRAGARAAMQRARRARRVRGRGGAHREDRARERRVAARRSRQRQHPPRGAPVLSGRRRRGRRPRRGGVSRPMRDGARAVPRDPLEGVPRDPVRDPGARDEGRETRRDDRVRPRRRVRRRRQRHRRVRVRSLCGG